LATFLRVHLRRPSCSSSPISSSPALAASIKSVESFPSRFFPLSRGEFFLRSPKAILLRWKYRAHARVGPLNPRTVTSPEIHVSASSSTSTDRQTSVSVQILNVVTPLKPPFLYDTFQPAATPFFVDPSSEARPLILFLGEM